MGFLKDLSKKLQASPVTEALSKVDPVFDSTNNTINEAVATGWGKPLGSEKSGLDVLGAGPLNQFGIGGDPNKPEDRAVGRAVGSFFLGGAASSAASEAGVSASTVNTVKAAAGAAAAFDQARDARNAADRTMALVQGNGIGSPPVPVNFDFIVPSDQAAAVPPQALRASPTSPTPAKQPWVELAIALVGIAISLNPSHG